MQAQASLSRTPVTAPPVAGNETDDDRQTYYGGGWIIFLLLTVMLLNVAWSVRAAGWAAGLDILQPAVLTGLLVGAGLAIAGWNGSFARLYALVTGSAMVLFLTTSIVPGDFTLFQKVQIVWEHSLIWTAGALTGRPLADNLVFVFQMAFLTWWLAYLASWSVFRQGRVWRAVVPVGLAMLVNSYYGPPQLRTYLVVFLISALLLVVRSNLTEQEREWRAAGVRYASDIGIDFLRDGAIFVVLVILLAWVTPTAAASSRISPLLDPLEGPWETVRQEWGRLFSSLNYQPGSLASAFGKSMSLSGPRSLGDAVVMDVKAPRGAYWRGVAFDDYNGRQWVNTDRDAISMGQGRIEALPVGYAARQVMTQTVTTYLRGETVLFAAPQPIEALLPARVDVSRVPARALALTGADDKLVNSAEPVEISRLRTRQPLNEGDSYMIVSAVSTADETSLRREPATYPSYVRDRFLQVPDSLPQNVRDLAQQITQTGNNQYDKARAIEQYLRTEIKYNEKIAAPPPGVDGVEYVLFQTKEGYCDYYASAMVMLARSAGIPARFVAGYAQGEYVPDLGVYRVREANAHSWVEVFFPDYGWIEFEPTAAQPQITRPLATDNSSLNDDGALANLNDLTTPEDRLQQEDKFGSVEDALGNLPPSEGSFLGALPPAGRFGAGVLALLLLGALGYLGYRFISRRTLRVLNPDLSLRIYERLERWAARIGLGRRPSQTPFEHASVLGKAVPEGAASIRRITDVYVRECFSPAAVSANDLEGMAMEWQTLQPTLRRYWQAYRARLPLRRRFSLSRK